MVHDLFQYLFVSSLPDLAVLTGITVAITMTLDLTVIVHAIALFGITMVSHLVPPPNSLQNTEHSTYPYKHSKL